MTTRRIERSVSIDASLAVVWDALTNPSSMAQWMGEPEMRVVVDAEWTVGGSIVVSAFHHVRFQNKGTVVRFEPPHALGYTQWSSLSQLPDSDENHTLCEFGLRPVDDGTLLTVTLSGFATESIFKHLDFYWRGTVGVLKRFVER